MSDEAVDDLVAPVPTKGRGTDAFDGLAESLIGHESGAPWRFVQGERIFCSDLTALELLASVPVRESRGFESGRLARAIDLWVADELRRAGFGADEVWPRSTAPRVLPREVALLLESLPRDLRERVAAHVGRTKAIAPADARVLGRAYVKQVDVLIAQWSRGPELIVSTKSMTSSFRNNLANRFEEAYGDARNLHGRFPLAATGYLLLLRSTAQMSKGTLERAADMLRKLRQDEDGYDSTAMLVAEWSDVSPAAAGVSPVVALRQDLVPQDLHVEPFLQTLIECVLDRTPIDTHVRVRELHSGQDLEVAEEADEGVDGTN